jgi:23S rRNA pseudouridine2604 synthase
VEFPIRINKYLAEKGHATRRGADALIESGIVFVNGKKALMGQQIQASDTVEVRGAQKSNYQYLLYYKPRGVITHSPEAHETDIAMQIKADHSIEGVFPVGRLDKDSEGLILLTNDGRITKRLLDPENDHEKEYEVLVDKRVTGAFLRQLTHGVSIEGYRTKPAAAVVDTRNDCKLHITLTEGKKHQIRRMCAALGYQVKELRRTRILGFGVRPLTVGKLRRLSPREVQILYKSLGVITPTL